MTRRSFRRLLVTPLLLLMPAAASAQERPADVPAAVTDGLEAYAAAGVDAALDVWLQGWPDEDVAIARPQLRNAFVRLDENAGPMLGYDLVGVTRWGERARRVYALMLYESQPVYARFDVYRPAANWKVVNVTVNTDPAQIFPAELFTPR